MKMRILVGVSVVATAVCLAGPVMAQGRAAAAAPPRLVSMTVGDPVGEKMEFSKKQIVAKPGERLKIQLFSIGKLPKVAMAHNWVLLKAGTDPKKFVDAAAGARATDFIPPAMTAQVIAYTDLIGPGERTEVILTAPTKPGSYRYLCSFPGHFAAGMFGDLVVK